MDDFSQELLEDPYLPMDEALVPAIIGLQDDVLHWELRDFRPHEGGLALVEPELRNTHSMLSRFCKIRDAKGVLRFASRFGVLGICEHGLPSTHERGCLPRGFGTEEPFSEPVDQWLLFARQGSAAMRLADGFERGDLGLDKEDWESLYTMRVGGDPAAHVAKVRQLIASEGKGAARFFLSGFVNWWLELGDVRPALAWREKGGLVFGSTRGGGVARIHPPTFGILASQLMLAVGRIRNYMQCSYCGLYYPRRKALPRRGKRNCCPDCKRKGLDNKILKRESRARKASPG